MLFFFIKRYLIDYSFIFFQFLKKWKGKKYIYLRNLSTVAVPDYEMVSCKLD